VVYELRGWNDGAMRRQNILRTLLFLVFFSIGAAALSGSILCDDLLRYYQNKQLLKAEEESLKRLETLNTDYEALLQQLEKEPNAIKRIAPATLGTEPETEDTVYPEATDEQLTAARKTFSEEANGIPNSKNGVWRPGHKAAQPEMPRWLMRCIEPPQRVILFLAGAFLILISFICFGAAKKNGQEA
jgi:cell division protein FtsB